MRAASDQYAGGYKQAVDASRGLPFLAFELGGQLYGIEVEQVEAIVEGKTISPEEKSLEKGDVILWPFEGEQVPVRCLARWVGLDATEESATRVLFSRGSEGLQGFWVGTPRDIVTLPLEEIFPIPILIRRVLGPSPLWGIGRAPQGLLLLVNLTVTPGDDPERS
jgi:chemotaxis signal transduction protein